MKASAAVVGILSMLASVGLRAEETFYDNVLIVLDASGSMAERMGSSTVIKIDAAKSALKEVLKTVPPSTRIGLLVFSSSNLTNDWLYPLGPLDEKKLLSCIDLPSPGGRTPLGAYIKKAADCLLAEREKQHTYGTYRLLIVTDGQATDGNLTDLYAPEVIARGITVDVIGVNMAERHTLATRAHSYRSANDPQSLTRAITDVFAEVSAKDTQGPRGQEDYFSVIAPIPAAMASAMLSALAASGNHPIGEPPPAPKNAEPPSVPPPGAPHSEGGKGGLGVLLAVLFVVVIVAVVRAAVRREAAARSKGGRRGS